MADVSKNADEYATVIGPDAKFKGELTFQGGVRIDGAFDGSITTSGKVFVSQAGKVKAEVSAASVALEGELEGNLSAKDRVELRASGVMRGDVKAAKLLVVEGATFVGRVEVGPNVGAGSGASSASGSSASGSSASGSGRKPESPREAVAAAASGRK